MAAPSFTFEIADLPDVYVVRLQGIFDLAAERIFEARHSTLAERVGRGWMVELKREGRSLHVVLVDGNTAEPGPIVSKVKQALAEDEVAEVVIELAGEEEAPPRPVVAEVIQELTSETLARGVPVRFKL